jgi:transcriptional regulator with XRE-family HTH domain
VSAEEMARFGALLHELKDRSGLSYGTLAKRLHMSGSTLHRYCNGEAVPTDYASIERFARLCKASPDELIEAHRRWVLADAARKRERKPSGAAADEERDAARGAVPEAAADSSEDRTVPGPASSPGPEAAAPSGPGPQPLAVPGPAAPKDPSGRPDPSGQADPSERPDPVGQPEAGRPTLAGPPEAKGPEGRAVPNRPGGGPGRGGLRGRKRPVLLATVAVAVVVACAAIAVNLLPGGDDDNKQKVGSAASVGRSAHPAGASHAAPSASSSGSAGPSESSSATTQAPPSPSGPAAGHGDTGTGPPLTVATSPYTWEDPCSQAYLVDKPPDKVPPPPAEQEAKSWVGAMGGVSAGGQYITLTVQGTGEETVVLDSLDVHVVRTGTPPAWSAYQMGDGCGGGVPTKSFDVDLDHAHPDSAPRAGQRDFPYKVSESDPEVLYVTAHTDTSDVRWYLELQWSSGDRHGTLRIDDAGQPFHTAALKGRPRYKYPNGGTRWIGYDDV